jgi:dienelactone hydrolase
LRAIGIAGSVSPETVPAPALTKTTTRATDYPHSTMNAIGLARRTRHGEMGISSLLAALSFIGCAGANPGSVSTPGVVPDSGSFVVSGNAESTRGATWTFRGRVDGVDYDLAGVLFKPEGPGPFPAVLLSHGSNGKGAELAAGLAPTMVRWGLVCIAPNYTHASGVPMGAPGGSEDLGASRGNLLRAHMTYELLRRLGYVDMSRVALHGHSMGAYLGAALASAYPHDFRVASATGGGVRPANVRAGPAPTIGQVSRIRIPYQMHHGSADDVVPPSYDERLAALLAERGVPHELYMYPGGHLVPRFSPLMLERLRAWYEKYGMF